MRIFFTILEFFSGNWTIYNGITCWFSAHFWDVHDYHIDKGGNGTPIHFYNYKCPVCDKKFVI
jgi:hypothetical protein